MPAKKKTNDDKYKDTIMELVSKGSLCHHCLAKDKCKEICKAKSIDPSKQEAPCKEAWIAWSNLTE